MPKISLDEFCAHWVKGKMERTIVSRFEKNVLDFTLVAGNRTKMFFQASFTTGGFYGSGTRWQARESKWGKRFTHPVLNDTGKLRNNIKSEGHEVKFGRFGSRDKTIRRGARYNIWTEEISTPQRGKRGKSGRYGRYAAVHNSDPSKTNYTVNQYSSRKPVQRQFIGFSQKLDADISKHIYLLFRGFPQ